MALTVITNQNIALFQPILPQGVISRKSMMFGYVEDGIACATAVVEEMDKLYSLVWLWVAPAYRRRGIGSELLEVACRFSMERTGRWLDVSYPADAEYSGIFRYMFLRKGFRLQKQILSEYRLSRQEVSEAWFMKNMDEQKEQALIIPLKQIEKNVLQVTVGQMEYQKQYVVSRADFQSADGECSMVLMKDGEVKGITLIHKEEGSGRMRLELFYLDPKHVMSGMLLLRRTVQAMLQQPEGLQEIRFTCIYDYVQQLAQRMLGNIGREDREIFTGILDLDFYRWRGKANV